MSDDAQPRALDVTLRSRAGAAAASNAKHSLDCLFIYFYVFNNSVAAAVIPSMGNKTASDEL